MRSVFASAKVKSAPQRRSRSPRRISCLSPHSLGCSMTGVSPTGSRRGLVRPPCTRIFAIICKPRLQCKEASSLLKGDRCVPKEVCVLKSRLGTTGRGISVMAVSQPNYPPTPYKVGLIVPCLHQAGDGAQIPPAAKTCCHG